MIKGQTETPLTERTVVRRGLIAGLAGMAAATMLRLSGTEKASAADNDPLLIAQDNVGTLSTTRLRRNGGLTPTLLGRNGTDTSVIEGGDGLQGISENTVGHAAGVRGIGQMVGVLGEVIPTGVGVIGRAGNVASGLQALTRTSIGVDGQATGIGAIGTRGVNSQNGTGVYGISNASNFTAVGDGSGVGVHGKTGSGQAVLGQATSPSAPGAFGVRGVAAGNGTGVRGVSNTGGETEALGNGSGVGVQGRSGSGPGVEGLSTNSLGVRGISTNFTAMVGISTNGHGLYGSTSHAGSAGFVGENLAGGLAGYFAGNVFVTGSLQVAGGKNAVLKMQDGTLASVYCQESPEPYFEDFGRAQLVGGVANVALEREFATLVAGSDYHVFTHPDGDTRGLFVSRKGPAGFEVRECQGGTGSFSFSYRVVTKRKDIEGRRFARVTDTVAPGLAAARAAMGVTGTPPVNNAPPNPVTPPPFVPPPPGPAPAPPASPTQPSPQAPQTPGPPGLIPAP